MKGLLLAGVMTCAVAALVSIISTAIPYWVYINPGSSLASQHFGLWKDCGTILSESACTNIKDAPGWIKAVQALMILGTLFLVLCLVLGIFQTKVDSRQIFQGSVVTAVMGGLVFIIAVIIFGVKEKDLKSDFHAGFYLALVAGILAFVAAVLLAVSKRGSAGYGSM